MGYNFSPKIVTDGLVLYLDAANPKSYVSGSTTWRDLSRGGNNGNLINGSFSNNNNGVIDFNGVNTTVNLQVNPQQLGMISGSYSIICWFYPDTTFPSTSGGALISSNTFPSAGNQYALLIRGDRLIASYYFEDQPVAISSGSWQMFSHTYNFNNKNSRVYTQNTLRSTITRTLDLSSTSNFVIGWYNYGGGYIDGRMSQLYVYNRELSISEITQNYNATKTRFGL